MPGAGFAFNSVGPLGNALCGGGIADLRAPGSAIVSPRSLHAGHGHLPGCDAEAMRINVFTPGEFDQGGSEVDAYSIEGGALRMFSQSDQHLAAIRRPAGRMRSGAMASIR